MRYRGEGTGYANCQKKGRGMTWPFVPLEMLAHVSGGSTPSRSVDVYWNGNVPWVTPSELPAPGASIVDVLDTADYITHEGLSSCSASLLPPGTVLFSSRATIGKIGIARVPLATNQGFVNFTPDPGVKTRYLAYALRFFTPQIAALAGSTTFKEVSRGAIRKFSIPLPPPSEQQRIVEVLDQIDALQRKRSQANEKAQRIVQALFVEMFGDPATNPTGWPAQTLDDVIVETQYGTSIKADADKHGIPIVRMNNIDARGGLNLSKLKYVALDQKGRRKYMLESGDILFNRTNSKELVGKTGLWRGQMEAVPASYLIRVRVDREQVLPEYVWAYMNTPFMKKTLFNKSRRAIEMANINARELRSFPIVIPSSQLQQEFASRLSEIERHIAMSARARIEQDRVLRVLVHRAFSGELTADWRDEHADELSGQIEAQARALEIAWSADTGRAHRGRPQKVVSC